MSEYVEVKITGMTHIPGSDTQMSCRDTLTGVYYELRISPYALEQKLRDIDLKNPIGHKALLHKSDNLITRLLIRHKKRVCSIFCYGMENTGIC